MARLFDMAKMTVSGTPSTGTFTLNAAAPGFQTFADAGASDGDSVFYSAKGLAGWEVGQGTIGATVTTLTRGPTSSSNSNAAVDFGSDVIVEISALAKSFIQTITLDGNTAGTSAPIISPTLDFAGGNNITLSGTSNTISIIGPVTVAQTVQTLGLFAVGNTTGTTSSMTRDARTLSFDGAGIASVGFSAGSIIISASTAATNPLVSIFAVGNTTSDASSGVIQAGSLSFDGAGIVSVGVAGSSVVISAPSPVASGTIQNRFAGGNSFGQSSSAVGTLSSLNISATGGISAGFSTDASSGVLMLSVAPPVASGTVGNYFASGNTTAISSSSTHTLSNISISGAGIVSVGVSTTGAGAGILVVSATSAESVGSLSLFAVGNTTVSSSTSSALPEALSLSGVGIITVGYSSNTILLSATTAASVGSLSLFAVGNTTVSSSTSSALPEALSLSGAGIITVGYSSNTILLSATTAASGAVQNEYAIGNTTAASSSTTQTLSSISISGAGIVSVGYSTTAAGAGALVISASTAASQGSLSLFAVGNTTISSSTSSALPEALSLSGAGIITVGYSSNTILLSATVAASGAIQNQYAIGNTTAASSSTTQTLSSISVSGAGIVSVGYSTTGAGAGALVISASTAATNPLLSLFAVGNTTTSVSSGLNQAGSLSFDGAGIVSVGISGSSVVISAPSPAASGTVGNYFASGNTTAISSSSSHTLSAISISGAGIVSVGVSTTGAAAGILVVSASTAATNPLLSLFAVGNTTSSVSSGLNQAGSLSFDGAGIVSVGISNSSIVISASTAATNPLISVFAVGNTTSSVSSGVIQAGSISFDGAGIVSVGISNSSVVVSAPSPNLSLFAVGNTTVSSSTSSVLPEALSFSGAGVASVGYSSNTIIISAPAAANALISLFAVGNTTSSVSSGVQGQNSLSFDGAGIVSVGISNSSIVISASTAATNPVVSIFAVGNTTSSVSSGVIAAGSMSFDAAGALSVGVSNSSVVLSSPDVSTLSGVSGITTTTGGSTISIGEQVISFLEPRPWLGTLAGTWAIGTMAVEPFIIPRPLTVNQANFMSSRAVAAPAMTLSSSTASRTVTASATWGSTASLVVYSQQDATSFSSFSSTTASFGMSAVLSASYSSSSKTGSQTVTFGWPQGTSAAVTSSMSTTFSTVSASLATQVMHTSSSLFANWLRNDYPFAASFPPGLYLIGIMWSSASGTSTLSTGLATISGPTWLATNGAITLGPGTSVIAVPGAAISNPFPGIGSTSSAASAVPATIAWQSLSTNAGIGTSGNPVNYFYLNQG